MCEEEWDVYVSWVTFLVAASSSYNDVSAAPRGSATWTVTAGMVRPAGTRSAEGAAGVRMT